MTLLFSWLKGFGGWFVAALAAAGAVFVSMRASKHVGKADTRVDEAERNLKAVQEAARQETKTVKEAIDVQTSVNRLDNGVAASKLLDNWARD